MFEELAKRTSSALMGRAEDLSAISLSESSCISIPFTCLQTNTTRGLCDKLTSIKKSAGIYVIEMDGSNHAKGVQDLLKNYKCAYEKELKFPKFNILKNNDKSKVLYVGSSQDLKKRLNEHLCDCSSQTYALRLSRWAGSLNGNLHVKIAVFEGASRNQLQDLEDQLAYELRPIFGRRGGI